jgi:putrescine transport system ATP-binding protein
LRAVSPLDCKSGDSVWVALRPEKVRFSCERPAASEANCVTGNVCNIAYLGEHLAYKVRLEAGFTMKATLPNTTRVAEQIIRSNDRVWLSWSEDAAVVLTR